MSRNLANDSLKLVLAVMVIGLHANLFFDTSPVANQLFVNGISRIAVPTFFVINGYYLSGTIKDKVGFTSWAKRIALGYAFWMAVYSPFYLPALGQTPTTIIYNLTRYSVFGYYHLWYLCGLLYAVALLFALRNKSDKTLANTALVLFLVGVVIQYYIFYTGIKLPYFVYRHFLFFAFPMVTAGYLIRKGYGSEISDAKVRNLLFAGFLLLLIEVCIAYIFRVDASGIDIFLSLLLIGPMLFIVTNKIQKTVANDHLSKLSSAIYFLHPLSFWVGGTFFHVTTTMMNFLFAIAFCLVVYYPLFLLSKKLKFIL
ncbi:MAG: acyltransferase [Anaerolineales bacterium]|nr:acyltransferase [Anaerolineales bacterium]